MVMEFFDQIRSYVTVFILFGAWSSTHGFQHKTPLRIYSVACFFAMILLFSMSVYSQRFYTYTTISNTVANSLYWLVMLTHSVVVFESILENKAQKQLIGKFMLVDHLFQVNKNIRSPYEKEKRELLIMSLAIILTIFFMYLAIYTYLYYSNNIRSFTIQSTVSIWMIRLRLMQMTFFVWILRNRLILLNQHLEIMSSVVKTDSTEPIFPKILNLKQIYQELHDACDLINVTFGISLLAILTQSFIDITSSCYWAYLTQQEGGKLIMFTAVIIQQSGVLCISGLACSLCYQEGRFVEKNLHRISIDRENRPEHNLIREFSLQVHHERFVISGNGFFLMNLKLLGSMFMACITFVVILIQFEQSNK